MDVTDNLHGPNTNHSCNFELRDFDRVKVVKLPGGFYCCSKVDILMHVQGAVRIAIPYLPFILGHLNSLQYLLKNC